MQLERLYPSKPDDSDKLDSAGRSVADWKIGELQNLFSGLEPIYSPSNPIMKINGSLGMKSVSEASSRAWPSATGPHSVLDMSARATGLPGSDRFDIGPPNLIENSSGLYTARGVRFGHIPTRTVSQSALTKLW